MNTDHLKYKDQRDLLLNALGLITVDKDGDGFICKEAMAEIDHITSIVYLEMELEEEEENGTQAISN